MQNFSCGESPETGQAPAFGDDSLRLDFQNSLICVNLAQRSLRTIDALCAEVEKAVVPQNLCPAILPTTYETICDHFEHWALNTTANNLVQFDMNEFLNEFGKLYLLLCNIEEKHVHRINCNASGVFKITSQPSICSILSLRNLKILALTANNLKELPAFPSSTQLPALEELLLNYNRIETLQYKFGLGSSSQSYGALSSFAPKLRVLDLSYNSLHDLKGLKELLQLHPVLERLSLSCNKIKGIVDGTLPLLTNLKCLGLFANQLDWPEYCHIKAISNESCAIEKRKKSLDICLSLLKASFPVMEDIYINGNPLLISIPKIEYLKRVRQCISSVQYVDGVLLADYTD